MKKRSFVMRACFGALFGVSAITTGCAVGGGNDANNGTDTGSANAPASSNGSNNSAAAAIGADAVAIDFYSGGAPKAACAGTLLAARVVLTAAHCADQTDAIRVTLPNASKASAEVSEILFYDWSTAATHAQEHDLAVLILRTEIDAPSFAALDDSTALRADVTADVRSLAADGSSAVVAPSTATTVLQTAPVGRPFALEMKAAPSGHAAGGAVRRPNGSVLGIYMGVGASTGSGYFARIDDGSVMRWMKSAVESQSETFGLAPNAGATLNAHPASGLYVRNIGGGGTTGSGSGSSGSDTPPSEDTTDDQDSALRDLKIAKDAPAKVDTPHGVLHADSSTAKQFKGDNYWAAFNPDDPIASDQQDKAYSSQHTDIAEIGTHGAPGLLEYSPDADTLKSITQGKDGMVVASCYAGAKPDGDYPSNAASLADQAGIPHSNVYGCTGRMAIPSSGNEATCAGTWVDADGNNVPADKLKKYSLTTIDHLDP